MKVYVLTIHCIHNFGSVFQSYALVERLRGKGEDASIIDYRPAYYTKGRNALKSFIARLINYVPYHKQHRRYQRFIDKEIPKTSTVFQTIDDLNLLADSNSIFIAGGDQIWNSFHPCGRDDAYKLVFAKDQPKIAFGTSMGRNSFKEEELKELAKKVSDFKHIALREKSTVEMLKPYTDVPVSHVCDPVLLLNKQDYNRFIGDTPIIKEPYLLMYLADKSDLLEETVTRLARKYGLKIVHVCGFRKKCTCDYFLKATGPEDLLNLIYYSKFVVSASFHATLFSLLFEKEFCTLLPEAGTNTRIEDLLSYFGLSERIVHQSSDIARLETAIDYSIVTPHLERFADQSRALLDSILKDCTR